MFSSDKSGGKWLDNKICNTIQSFEKNYLGEADVPVPPTGEVMRRWWELA